MIFRPNGQRNDKFTLKPVAAELEKQLGKKVIFLNDCVGEEVRIATLRKERTTATHTRPSQSILTGGGRLRQS